jgi:hypothetical protein
MTPVPLPPPPHPEVVAWLYDTHYASPASNRRERTVVYAPRRDYDNVRLVVRPETVVVLRGANDGVAVASRSLDPFITVLAVRAPSQSGSR